MRNFETSEASNLTNVLLQLGANRQQCETFLVPTYEGSLSMYDKSYQTVDGLPALREPTVLLLHCSVNSDYTLSTAPEKYVPKQDLLILPLPIHVKQEEAPYARIHPGHMLHDFRKTLSAGPVCS